MAANRLAAAGAACLFTSRVISARTLQQAGPGKGMKDYWMLQNTKSQGNGPWILPMADQLTGGTNSCFELGIHWLGLGGQPGRQPGQGQAGSPREGGLMRMLGRRQHREGNRLSGSGPSAQYPEGGSACPAKGMAR